METTSDTNEQAEPERLTREELDYLAARITYHLKRLQGSACRIKRVAPGPSTRPAVGG